MRRIRTTQRGKFFFLVRELLFELKRQTNDYWKSYYYIQMQSATTTAQICEIITPKAADQIMEIARFYRKREG